MSAGMMKKTYAVQGMTCAGCEKAVESALSALGGVHAARADCASGTVAVQLDPAAANFSSMAAAVKAAGYALGDVTEAAEGRGRAFRWAGLAVLLFAAWFVVDRTVGFSFFPEVDASMGYGMLFFMGLLTSLHCVAMCGGIQLAHCASAARESKPGARLKPGLLYNAGRVVSYTVVGGIVGAVGSVVGFSGWARGVVAVAAGVFMMVMGLHMLGVPWLKRFVPKMPAFMLRGVGKAGRGRGPFVVGLLNGLMPCGPLQAMQVYALGTGGFLSGALSMLLFGLGTAPLMLGLGALASLLGARLPKGMLKAGAALVLLLGLVTVNRGLSLSGVGAAAVPGAPQASVPGAVATAPAKEKAGTVQDVTARVTSQGYPDITVRAGVPVRWNLKADAGALNGCNRTLVIPALDRQIRLKSGDNIIEFMPTEAGTIPYSCWMGMITGRIRVVP